MEPEFYKLQQNTTSICLATGFTRHDDPTVKNSSLFSRTKPARFSSATGSQFSSIYTQVAFIEEENDMCPGEEPRQ